MSLEGDVPPAGAEPKAAAGGAGLPSAAGRPPAPSALPPRLGGGGAGWRDGAPGRRRGSGHGREVLRRSRRRCEGRG